MLSSAVTGWEYNWMLIGCEPASRLQISAHEKSDVVKKLSNQTTAQHKS